MGIVRWKLADYLEREGITPYRLAKAVGDEAQQATIYRLARRGQEPARVDLAVLATVLDGLRKVSNRAVSLEDVLEYCEGQETTLEVRGPQVKKPLGKRSGVKLPADAEPSETLLRQMREGR